MIEVRFHGRGGQGAVIASEILAAALFLEGKYVQAFPSFGVERRGAPVAAFLRMDFRTIRLRCQIQKPDHVVILDPTLIPVVDVTAGLRPSGWILISHQRGPEAFTEYDAKGWKVATVDAATIALDHKLGSATNPIVNTAILGAFARITRLVSLDSVLRAIQEGVPQRPEANCQAARDAYRSVRAGAALSVEAS